MREVRLDPDEVILEPVRGPESDAIGDVRDLDAIFRELGASRALRRVVQLRMFGCSTYEIARMLHTTPWQVQRRIREARELLFAARGFPYEHTMKGARPGSAAAGPPVMPGSFHQHPRPEVPDHSYSRPPLCSPTPVPWQPGGDAVITGRASDPSSRRTRPASRRRSTRRGLKVDRKRQPAPPAHPVLVCRCCEARLRPLTAGQAFGWREVYYSEVHRCQPRW